jgi:hypothetical protein
MRLPLPTLGSLAILISCATAKPASVPFEVKWVGKTAADFISTVGPPTRVTTDGKGGQILVVENTNTAPRFCLGGCPPGHGMMEIIETSEAWVGPDGLIYHAVSRRDFRFP